MKPCLFSPSSSIGHHIRRSKLVAPYVRSIDPRQTCEVLLWSWSTIHACLIWQPQQGLWNLDYTSIWFFSSCMAMNLWASVYPSDSIHVHKKKCNSGLPWTKSCGVNLVPLWSLRPSVNLSQGCRMLMKNDGQYQILFFMHLKLRCIHEMRSGSKFKICWIRFSLVQIHETSSPLSHKRQKHIPTIWWHGSDFRAGWEPLGGPYSTHDPSMQLYATSMVAGATIAVFHEQPPQVSRIMESGSGFLHLYCERMFIEQKLFHIFWIGKFSIKGNNHGIFFCQTLHAFGVKPPIPV